MNRKRIMRILTFLIFFCYASLFSQPSELHKPTHIKYRFVHMGVADGLSPGVVNCFYKDSKGFIWIGTTSGLDRYDGYEITTFNPDFADTASSKANNYKAISEDPLGNIWVQTAAGTKIFDPKTYFKR